MNKSQHDTLFAFQGGLYIRSLQISQANLPEVCEVRSFLVMEEECDLRWSPLRSSIDAVLESDPSATRRSMVVEDVL